MKKGIRCNETKYTPSAKRNRIVYRFVTGDNIIPSQCTVQLGEKDPLTGETITEVEFFQKYYKIVDQEIYITLKTRRPNITPEINAHRKIKAKAYISAFEAEYGYKPSRDDVFYHLEQKDKIRYLLSLEEIVNQAGESILDYLHEIGRVDKDPFGADLPDDLYELHEFAATLTGRKKAVYEAMLDNIANGAGKITNTSLAQQWGVSEGQIRKDQKQIIKMIREKLKK